MKSETLKIAVQENNSQIERLKERGRKKFRRRKAEGHREREGNRERGRETKRHMREEGGCEWRHRKVERD